MRETVSSRSSVSLMRSPLLQDPSFAIRLSVAELRLMRSALRFAQVSSDGPLSFHQDMDASILVARINALVNDEVVFDR